MIDNIIREIIKLTEDDSLSTKDKIFLFRQLGYLLDGGVAITEALTVIAKNTDKYSIAANCDVIYNYIKSGESFSKSLSRIPKYFDETDISIIRSGESSGNLVTVLHHLADEYEFLYDTRSKYISAMIYPGILLVLSVVAVFFLFLYVLPSIFDMISGVEWAEIPWYTKVIMNITNFVVNYNIYIIMWIILFGLLFWLFVSTDMWRKRFFEWVLWLPWVGKIIRNYNMIKFFRYMKLMYSSGINYLDMFIYLKKIMDNPTYTASIDQIIWWIRRGQTIYDNIKYSTNIIPWDAAALIQVGESTANIWWSIDNIINIYDKDLRSSLDNLGKIIEPVMVVLVWCVIWLIAGSVFGIMWAIMDTATTGGI